MGNSSTYTSVASYSPIRDIIVVGGEASLEGLYASTIIPPVHTGRSLGADKLSVEPEEYVGFIFLTRRALLERWEGVVSRLAEFSRVRAPTSLSALKLSNYIASLAQHIDDEEVREGALAVRNLLREAAVSVQAGRAESPRQLINRALHVSLLVLELLKLQERGVRLVKVGDLEEVGEIKGWKIYAPRRDRTRQRQARKGARGG